MQWLFEIMPTSPPRLAKKPILQPRITTPQLRFHEPMSTPAVTGLYLWVRKPHVILVVSPISGTIDGRGVSGWIVTSFGDSPVSSSAYAGSTPGKTPAQSLGPAQTPTQANSLFCTCFPSDLATSKKNSYALTTPSFTSHIHVYSYGFMA
ncbi:MAG: hypothetical protein QXY12_02565 [Pyrobaculum sp.]